MTVEATTVEHDLSSDVGRKSTDDDFAGKDDNSLSTSSTVGGVIVAANVSRLSSCFWTVFCCPPK